MYPFVVSDEDLVVLVAELAALAEDPLAGEAGGGDVGEPEVVRSHQRHRLAGGHVELLSEEGQRA